MIPPDILYGFKFPASGSVPVIFSSLELPEFLSEKIMITVMVALLIFYKS